MVARFFLWLCKLYFTITGWKIVGTIPPLKKYVVLAAPHTSAWDVVVGAGVRTFLNIDIKFLAKKEVFKFPFKNFMQEIGAYPVDRSKKSNLVDSIVQIFNTNDSFAFALAPEGTRSPVSNLKSGFYHIAKKAKVPIVCGALDYSRKLIVFKEPFTVEDKSWEETENEIMEWYRQFKGKHPRKGIL